jgi:hypothetical protein
MPPGVHPPSPEIARIPHFRAIASPWRARAFAAMVLGAQKCPGPERLAGGKATRGWWGE